MAALELLPPLPIKLPPLGDYPAAGTDAAKDQWLRLADLYMRDAQRATSWEASSNSAAATNALAAANALMAQQAASNSDVLPPLVDKVVVQWGAHDAAMDRLTAALASMPAVAGSGIPVADFVSILTALLKALEARP